MQPLVGNGVFKLKGVGHTCSAIDEYIAVPVQHGQYEWPNLCGTYHRTATGGSVEGHVSLV